jgi:hypothetical protein
MVAAVAALLAVEASAWNCTVNRAILMFAEENLSGRAKREVAAILGAPLSSIEFANKGKSKTHLDENGKSVTTDEKDAVVMLEKAIAMLKSESASTEERRAALRTAVEKTVDIHCLANILVEKHLEKDFTFSRHNSMQIGFRYYKVTKTSWQELWHNTFHNNHRVFSAEMYLYDWHIATKGMAKSYKKEAIEPRKWAEQSYERALPALKIVHTEELLENVEVPKLEEINNASLYAAAFHLANLLNETLK